MSSTRTITLGHSPDPDDAFMFYALARGCIDTGAYRFEHVLADIETLNRRALKGELDITAVSFHAYPRLADRYAVMSCGASMGDGYGPLLVARRGEDTTVAGARVAIPGELTSAYLALRLFTGHPVDTVVVPFDEIPAAVREGRADLGLLIHEGQLTYEDEGLSSVVDLGAWWKETTGLPLPLGANVIRRDLGADVIVELTRLVRASIAHALENRDVAVAHAREFGRGLDIALTDRFVGMYVNDWTVDLGADGRRSVELFLERGHRIGMIEQLPALDFVSAGDVTAAG